MTGQDHTTAGADDQFVPVTIVSGYLGAGKTTLINRLLRGDHGLRIAVLVNDFGEINIDADLISGHDGQTISLTNGCVCCSIADDLGQALGTVAALEPRAEHIIVEASGVADPDRIANFARGQPGICLDGTIVLVDAETIEERANDRFIGSTIFRQVSAADLIVITKTDLVARAELEHVEAWLQKKFPTAPRFRANHCAVAWDVLIGTIHRNCSGADTSGLGSTKSEHHADQFATATWQGDLTLSRDQTINALRSLSSDLLRCKGWVRFDDNPAELELVQMVGARIEITRIGSWDQQRRSALSFIYRQGSLSQRRLDTVMVTCQKQPATRVSRPNAPHSA